MLSLFLSAALATEPVPPPIVNGPMRWTLIKSGPLWLIQRIMVGCLFVQGHLLMRCGWSPLHMYQAVEEYAGYGMDVAMLGHSLYAQDGVDYYDTVAT